MAGGCKSVGCLMPNAITIHFVDVPSRDHGTPIHLVPEGMVTDKGINLVIPSLPEFYLSLGPAILIKPETLRW